MPIKRLKRIAISIFVVVWLAVFFYESNRYFYLSPLFGRPLPKVKFLFPPAGWIMFFNVDDGFGYAEVFGIKASVKTKIDPHDILQTKAVGYDNIHRNVSRIHPYLKQ